MQRRTKKYLSDEPFHVMCDVGAQIKFEYIFHIERNVINLVGIKIATSDRMRTNIEKHTHETATTMKKGK